MTHWGDLVQQKTDSFGSLVVGIDPSPDDIPIFFKKKSSNALDYLNMYVKFLIDISIGRVGFVKFQSAFFEAYGVLGMQALANGIRHAKCGEIGVILDAKRGDIGSTAAAYARAYLTPAEDGGALEFEVDCMTINPFLGPDTLEPFVECSRKFGKGLFILTKTSNPGAVWLQDKQIDGVSVSDRIAELIHGWSSETLGHSGLSAIGAVVGATFPKDGQRLRARMPDSVFLAPGIGPQGGTPADIAALKREQGNGVLVPVSRGISKADSPNISESDYRLLVEGRIDALKKLLS